MNGGGIRKDLDVGEDLVASYGQVQIVVPFGNTMVAMDMTGAQIGALLEQQWVRPGAADASILQISNGFSYTWNPAAPRGSRVVRGSMKLDGVPIEDGKTYRIAANNFLAEGGDNFPIFKEGKNKFDTGVRDFDVLVEYLVKMDKAGTPFGVNMPAGRIQIVK